CIKIRSRTPIEVSETRDGIARGAKRRADADKDHRRCYYVRHTDFLLEAMRVPPSPTWILQ
ncbi:MAG: hypothetical protein ACLR67_12240, partial [Eggerthella lenta]